MGLDTGPAGLLDIGSNFGKLIGRDLVSPVGLYSFLDFASATYGTTNDIIN